EVDRAAQVLERGLSLARDRDIALVLPFVLRPLGYVNVLAGRAHEGLSLLTQALGALESIRMRVAQALFVVQLGEASLIAEKVPDALAFARRALTLARECHEQGHEAYALRLLGEIASREDPPNLET